MTHGSLFCGIGGIDLGFERAGIETLWQVEHDDYCTRVLEKHWPRVQRFRDVRECGTPNSGHSANLARVDIISGGFPCQPVSLAGKRRGQDDPRWLWPEFARIVRELRPRYVVVENVPGLLHLGMGDVLGDLAACGYDAEWDCLPAAAFGAPHLRYRVFIVAYARCERDQRHRELRELAGTAGEGKSVAPQRQRLWDAAGRGGSPLADADDAELEGRPGGSLEERPRQQPVRAGGASVADAPRIFFNRPGDAGPGWRAELTDGGWWESLADFCGVVDGICQGLDEIDESMKTHYTMGYGKIEKIRPVQKVQELRHNNGEAVFRQSPRGSLGLSAPSVLRSAVYGAVSTDRLSIQPLLETLSQKALRELWEQAIARSSSFGRKANEQFAGEPADAVCEVPHALALAKRETATSLVLRLCEACSYLGAVPNPPDTIEAIWKSLSEKEKEWAVSAALLGPFHAEWPDVPRIVKSAPARVHRLRALGNAVVPQVAEWLGRRIVEADGD